MDTLAGIFTPVLPAVIGGGMITVVYTLLTLSGLVSAESNLGVFLNFLGNAPMYLCQLWLRIQLPRSLAAILSLQWRWLRQ